ncbi:hypothetical protein ACFCW4_32750 [Streptomyces virginiae]|uniref:hypothetical protein n=1 Tax=Streptomyces virginiae TaxID=1961 RepID=UPI0035DB12A8
MSTTDGLTTSRATRTGAAATVLETCALLDTVMQGASCGNPHALRRTVRRFDSIGPGARRKSHVEQCRRFELRYRIHVCLWFHGNSTAQHEVLADIAGRHDRNPEAFPYAVGPEGAHQEELDLDFGAGTGVRGRKRIG